jgi:hypothetical protein
VPLELPLPLDPLLLPEELPLDPPLLEEPELDALPSSEGGGRLPVPP